MDKRKPLTFQEVKKVIGELGPKLEREIRETILSANDRSNYYGFNTLVCDTKAMRVRGAVADTIRKFEIECSDCEETAELGRWQLLQDETVLQCPLCHQSSPRNKYHRSEHLEELLGLAPVMWVKELFAKE